jgi:hypothetical protein
MPHGGARPGAGRKPKTAIPERLWQDRFVLPPGLDERQLRLVRELCQRVYQAGREDTFRQFSKAQGCHGRESQSAGGASAFILVRRSVKVVPRKYRDYARGCLAYAERV